MRGNSGFLRLAVFGCLLVCSVLGGPPRPRRMMRETFSSSIEESVPMSANTTVDAGNSDTCSFNGKEVLRSSVNCEKKNGCREIETHGECCPKFICECKLNGTIYDNGDKIVDPENPCEVCVCRGGEINCNALKCYSRNDCKNVTYTPGVCCPEYANCPPLENVELNSSNETSTTESSINYSTGSSTVPSESSTTLATTTAPTSIQPIQPNDNPVGIKIKEITKPEEIRITDDRPKIFQTIKSSEATKTSSALLHSQETAIEPEHESPIETNPDEISEIQSEIEPEIEQHTTFFFDGSDEQPIRLESSDLNTVGHVSMGPKIVRQTDVGIEDEVHTTISPFSTENEIKDETLSTKLEHVTDGPIESTSVKHNTSVLQVGDSVVIFDRSGQSQSIPLRVAGLQRGEDTYDEEDERKEGRKSDGAVPSESSSIEPILEHSTTTETVYEAFYYEPQFGTTGSFDSGSSESSDEQYIRDLGLNDDLKEVGSGAPSKIEQDDDNSSGDGSSIDTSTDPMTSDQSTVDEITVVYDSDEGTSSSTVEGSASSEHFYTSTSWSQFYSSESPTTDSYDEVQHDQNINFPHITDDLTEDRMEDEDKFRVNSRIVEGDLENIVITSDDLNRSQEDSSSTIAPPEGVNESLNYKDVEGRSPGEPLLIPEWERNHTTVAPFDILPSSSNETEILSEISSHVNQSIDTVVGDESTTNHSDLSSTTDFVDTNASASESNSEAESIEYHSTSGPSQVRETNNFNLFLDGTADFFRIQKKIWDSTVA